MYNRLIADEPSGSEQVEDIKELKIEILIQKICILSVDNVQGGSNMTGTDCLQFTYKKSRSYLKHLV